MVQTNRPGTELEIGEPEEITLSQEEDEAFRAAEAQADRDAKETRITMRIKQGQLDLIQRAAEEYGMPYQSYIKQAATRQAIADLQALARVPRARL